MITLERHFETVVGVAVLSVALGLSGCALFSPGQVDTTQRDNSGAIVGEGTVGVLNLSVGDCLNGLDFSAEEVYEATGIPCSEPHVYEVYHVESLEGYTLQALADSVSQICEDRFQRFTGVSYLESSLEFSNLIPTSEGFAEGDNVIQCFIHTSDLSMVTGTLRGMGASYLLVSSQWGEVGDCIDVVYDSSGNPLEDRFVSCQEPHVFEVFFVGTASSELLDDIVVEISDFCLEEWERYKDPSVNSEDYFITPLAPTEETYAQGDREVACWVHTESYESIVGSLSR